MYPLKYTRRSLCTLPCTVHLPRHSVLYSHSHTQFYISLLNDFHKVSHILSPLPKISTPQHVYIFHILHTRLHTPEVYCVLYTVLYIFHITPYYIHNLTHNFVYLCSITLTKYLIFSVPYQKLYTATRLHISHSSI
jgi:hypothetical protein